MRTIEVSTVNGSASGYVVSSEKENIKNYLSKHIEQADVVARVLAKKKCSVGLLRNMYVEEEFRGDGQGNQLMADFLEEAAMHDAEFILLVCDQAETQNEGFSLQKFYEDFDFVTAVPHPLNPLMVDSDEIAALIQREIKRESEKSATLEM